MTYDDVPTDEAIDLIATLPDGSLFAAALSPYRAWSDETEQRAQIVDEIERMLTLYATGTTEGAQRVTRPWMVEERKRVRERTKRAVDRLNSNRWKDVDDG